MPTPKKTSPERELRRLAIAGRWDDVRELLQARVAYDATDTEAKEELSRLERGLPLKAMMNAAERRAAAAQDATRALTDFMAQLPFAELKKLSKSELPEVSQAWDALSNTYLRYHKKLTPEMTAYGREIKSRRKKYRGFMLNKATKIACIAATAMVLGIGVNYFLKADAERECEAFSAALQHQDLTQVLELKDKVNSGLNHFYCPELQSLLHRADMWIFSLQTEYRSVETDIRRIEKGLISVADMGLQGQVELEARIQALRLGKDELNQRWKALCQKERHALAQQKERVLQAVHAPLPTQPEHTGAPRQDYDAFNRYSALLEKRLLEATLANKAYHISQSALGNIEKACRQARQLCSDTNDFKRITDKLKKCRNYDEFLELINGFSPELYNPALELASIKNELPTAEDIAHRIMDPDGAFSRELLAAARKTLVEGAPTFSQAYPATNDQVVLMEDMFTAPSLRNKVYGIILPDGNMWFSTKKPYVDKTNFLIFQRSSIDPNYSVMDNRVELQNDGSIKLTEYDATGIMKIGDFEKNNFFNHAHLTRLLTATLNYEDRKTPALAQAYIYYTLIRLAHEHRHMLLSGARFSPSLKAHADSFSHLLKKQNITLEPGCWLSASAEVKAAEKAFEAWFREHRGANYEQEAAAHFRERFDASSRYAGYINAHGEFVARKSTRDADYLWFISDDGLARTPAQEPDFSPAHKWSPVFTENRNKAIDK